MTTINPPNISNCGEDSFGFEDRIVRRTYKYVLGGNDKKSNQKRTKWTESLRGKTDRKLRRTKY